MPKLVFVTGGVLSSVGKGIVCSSIGKMLQVRGYKVTAIKIDPYINVDSGTMNPLQHGEVFVTDDGGEIDLDMGHYERFLNLDLPRDQNITTGQIYRAVIEAERRGDYLGRCVQIIPHVTDEIKRRIRVVAKKSPVDVVLVECGGTVGDIEGLPFLEAIRQMRLEEGYENTLFVHVALVPILDVTGEEKTKPAQHSIQELRRIGIQPDAVVARSERMLQTEPRSKIALFGSVPEKAVFCSHTVKCAYQIPMILDDQGMGEFLCQRLGLPPRQPDWSDWQSMLKGFMESTYELRIAMCGKYANLADSYVSVNEALRVAGAVSGARVSIDWVETEIFEGKGANLDSLSAYDGILVPGGFGVRGTEGKIAAIEYARTSNVPYLGLCLGFQLAVVEFARHVCGLRDANSTELNPRTRHPVVFLMPEQRGVRKKGGTMRLGAYPVKILPNTFTHKLYDSDTVYERHRHRYEVNPEYWPTLVKHGLVFSGATEDGTRKEILELPKQRFFLATQFHPEFKSRPGRPDPAFRGFIEACLDRKLTSIRSDGRRQHPD